jgi:1-acyl-sn-glycerol-3-phosphate acyltransferase
VAKVRPVRERRGWAFAIVVGLLRRPLMVLTRRDWRDGEKVPAVGGCVLVVNHVSHLDPITLGHFLYDHGRLVRYLAKDALFTTPVVGPIVKDAKQIPVSRLTTDATRAFDAAVEAVNNGELVGVYPEGTITRDPDGWPMRGKTGAARIALATGCPVIPVGQWGAQEILPAYSTRPRLLPRKTVHYKVGDPVDLSDLQGKPLTNEVLHEATDRIMAAITALVEDLRGQHAPPVRFDPRASGVREIGNPRKAAKQRTDRKGRTA